MPTYNERRSPDALARSPSVRRPTDRVLPPQFHPIPENDVWWGKGFTEWVNVRRAKPNFVGHYQPHVTTELGYYDLRDAKTRHAQADLARAHGIHGFCYYYYWFNGRRLLHRPLDEVVESGQPDFPFCVCWANENWTRRWDGGHDELLLAQTYSPENEQRLIADLLPLFRDRRYIRVKGRPLLLVYRANLLPEPRRATGDVSQRGASLRRAGALPRHGQIAGMPRPDAWGFDAGVEFPPHSMEADIPYRAYRQAQPRISSETCGTTYRRPDLPLRGRCRIFRSFAESWSAGTTRHACRIPGRSS